MLLRVWEVTENWLRRKKKGGGEDGGWGLPGKNATEGQRAEAEPKLSSWTSPRHGCVAAMANSGNDEGLVWVDLRL